MTIATTSTLAGDTWTNVFSPDLMQAFQFRQNAAASLSSDKHTLTFSFINGDIVHFLSDDGFPNQNSGVINGVETEETTFSDFSYDLLSFQMAVRDGDVDAVNAALWGGNDVISGGASSDTIRGFAGSDTLFGNDGNDVLVGDGGNDKLNGGNGNDTMSGGAGNDTLNGGAGNDAMSGESGTDVLNGAAGNDAMSGGAGNDRLTGGAGSDQMTGGSGTDTFVFSALGDLAPFVANAPFSGDFIRDFNSVEGDRIDLHGVDANSVASGNQDFTFIGSNAFHANTPGEVRVVNLGSPFLWQVQISNDNDTAAEYAFAVISYSQSLKAGDFLL